MVLTTTTWPTSKPQTTITISPTEVRTGSSKKMISIEMITFAHHQMELKFGDKILAISLAKKLSAK